MRRSDQVELGGGLQDGATMRHNGFRTMVVIECDSLDDLVADGNILVSVYQYDGEQAHADISGTQELRQLLET